MGSSSSKFRKHLQAGDEVQALQLYRSNSELRKALDPNCSYGDSHQHETPLHLAAKHGMQTLLGTFLFSKGGNPKKTNAKKETCLHCVCMETNGQSIHVGKRRADCLIYLLKWRGATLAEGQLEKVDLAAQDEKLNTALHYAAASGLSQCVEILIQHGAPLFIENEDSLTPCDTAEKNGYARIALYLESKMVFSNDEEPHGEEDNVSMPPVEEYSGLRPQDLQEAKDHLLVETADMLSVPLFTAEALLRNHEWSREMLLEAWMNDPIACCEKCGVTPPATLFSDKPQVQENLASPLPSPLHTTPSPQDAECNICANTFLIADEPVHMTCAHQFCQDCWERYLNVKIQEGDAHRITCPAYNCTMLVPIDIIERIVSRDMALRYLQFDIKAFVDSNPDMKWCPYPGCGRAVKLPDLDLGSNHGVKRNKIPSDTSRGVDCGVGHYFCWECLEESHEPCSCENWSKWFQKISEIKPETLDGTEQETELAANCLWLVTNSKPCPNCKSPIQKNEGCNHMKCSKCKYDFCWVCLEQWKRHNSSTGGYFKCNRYEVLKKVEEQSAQLVSEAEVKNRNMQELNRFVHYYTRFKNHENSYKLEEPLLKTVKDKMMKLAEAVTDVATAHVETKFVEDAVQQLLKARRVLKCSYVYGFYLDGPGYKKIVFEFMQTELEECIEILSQMVNRLYLRTPRRKIMDQAHFVQRKRLEFIMAISKGLVPPETPPSVRKSKIKRTTNGGEADDEDLHRAIVASIQEVDPSNPWIKDASGRHTNVVALLEWPSDESEQSEGESDLRAARESIGKCHRTGCNKVRVKNPRTNEHHDYCSRWCMQVDKEEQNRKETEAISEIVLDEHMELLRALEMSRLQYLRDNGLLHVPDSRDAQQSPLTKTTKTRGQNDIHRPRSNSAGQEAKVSGKAVGLNSMKELGIELQRFHELSSGFPRGERDEATNEKRRPLSKSKTHHCHKLSQSSRFDECRSTVVTRVPNKSVEDLYCLDQTPKSSPADQSQGQLDESPGEFKASLLDSAGSVAAMSPDTLTGDNSSDVKSSSQSFLAASDGECLSSCSSIVKGLELMGSMFGAIKDISVSNIHSNESDKTKDFLSKDFAAIFANWDSDESDSMVSSLCDVHISSNSGCARRPLTLENNSASSGKGISGKNTSEKSQIKSGRVDTEASVSGSSNIERMNSVTPHVADVSLRRDNSKSGQDISWSWLSDLQLNEHTLDDDNILDDKLHSIGLLTACEDSPTEELLDQEKADGVLGDISLLEMAENLLQMTTDAHTHMKEVEKDIHGLHADASVKAQRLKSIRSTVLASREDNFEKTTRNTDTTMMNERGDSHRWCERIIGDMKQLQDQDPVTGREKIFFHLPRTAWSVDENEKDTLTKWSSAASKANRKSSSSQKTKIFDFDGSHRKSPRKSSSKSKKSKGGTVAIGLMTDTDGCVYEVPGSWRQGSETQTERHCPAYRLGSNRALEVASTSLSLENKSETIASSSSILLSCEERPYTADTGNSITDTKGAESSNKDIDPSFSVKDTETSENVVIPLTSDGSVRTSTSLSSSLVATAAGAESAEKPGLSDNNRVEYSLTRNISCDKLSHKSSYTAGMSESENQLDTTHTEIIEDSQDDVDNNVLATSALITDAYETATSDDNWEDCEEVDDNDLYSVYV